MPPALHQPLADYLTNRAAEFHTIPAARQAELDQLADYIKTTAATDRPLQMIFVCTHNSRRSHIAQLWAAAAAKRQGFTLDSYSGGTEDTAFNPRAVAALRRAGFGITQTTTATNPLYHAALTADPADTVTCFSKPFDSPPNPKTNFAAIMVCSEADAACPAVFGADFRLALPYTDPKAADDTPAEADTYDQRTAQIAREILYAFTTAANQ